MFICKDENINCNINSKQDVLKKIVDIALEEDVIRDKDEILKKLTERELEYTTDVQEFIAIPHPLGLIANESKIATIVLDKPI